MSTRSRFLAGCAAGVAATLAAAVLFLSPARRHRSRLREEHPNLPNRPLHQTFLHCDSLDPPDQSVFGGRQAQHLDPDVRLPVVEGPVHTDNNGRSGPDTPARGEPAPALSVVDAGFKSAWYRQFRGADYITAVVAVMVMAAVTCLGVAFRNQTQMTTAQLAESAAAMRELRVEVQADQRAWVGLAEATAQPLTADGGGFSIKLQNTGKTPALDVQVSDIVTIEEIAAAVSAREPTPASENSAGSMMPGASYTTDVWFKTSPDALYGLAHDQLRAVNFVRINYKDINHGSHVTKICFYWRSSLSRVKPCDSYNEAN